jgi:DNA-binding NarL/FixJ family response regulator
MRAFLPHQACRIAVVSWAGRATGRRWVALASRSVDSTRAVLELLHQMACPAFRPVGEPEIVTQSAFLKGLSPQQLAVLRLTAEGFSNAATASRLGVSRRTVENHLLGIYRNMGIAAEELNPRVAAVLRYLAEVGD